MIERSGLLTSFIGRLCLAASLLAVPAGAQTTAPAAFDVATVKLNKSGSMGSGTNYSGNTFTATNVTLKSLIQSQAFGVPGPRILGGPKWLDSTRFDVEAKVDGATLDRMKTLPREQGKQQMQSMFQQLLADRFQLKVHWETRELPVYALVVANPKNGPRLEKPKNPMGGGMGAGNGILQDNNASVADFAQLMTQEASSELGRVVIDKTGIDGKYDIYLRWTPEMGAGAGAVQNGAELPPPSIFTAVEEQLGLKLEPSKGPVQVLVIDSAEMPSGN